VAALNTISPPGRARTFDGEPVVAPWMRAYGGPASRSHYMCQNCPADVQARVDQALLMIEAGVTDAFQHDDWYGNAQMLSFGQPCFCEHCVAAFAEYLGIDLDYRRYLLRRGLRSQDELLQQAARGAVPLWDDFRRFAEFTVSRYFRRLRAAMDRFLGRPATLSVNGSVAGFGGNIETILPHVAYFHGETSDFSPAGLRKLAIASRRLGVRQVVSFFPSVPAAEFHAPAFVARVNAAIALCYCLGLLPLFPYDVWAGPKKPRWFGTWEQYGAAYRVVREHPEWFDEYRWQRIRLRKDRSEVLCRHEADAGRTLTHTVGADGTWRTEAS